MNLTITRSNNHYVVTTESGPILRIFNRKNLIWNLKHVFHLTSAEINKVLGKQFDDTGMCQIRVTA